MKKLSDNDTKGVVEMASGVIVALVAGFFGWRKQQSSDEKASKETSARERETIARILENERRDHELDVEEKSKLGERIRHLEKSLDSKDASIHELNCKIMSLNDDRLKLKTALSQAVIRCSSCDYCNCDCVECQDCVKKKIPKIERGKTHE